MLYPDAQIEYEDAGGRTGRVNVEVASGNYREPALRAKAAAGFAMHANGPAAAGLLKSEAGVRFLVEGSCGPSSTASSTSNKIHSRPSVVQ